MSERSNEQEKIRQLEEDFLGVQVLCRARLAVIDKLTAQAERDRNEIENWKKFAKEFSENVDFYRNLLVKTGELFGIEAKTSDDGSIQDSVLALKVPELVKRDRETIRELIELLRYPNTPDWDEKVHEALAKHKQTKAPLPDGGKDK